MTDVSADLTTDARVEDGVYRGQLEREGDRDWVAVELTAGITYTIRVLGSDSDNGTAQYLRIHGIYDADGEDVGHNPAEFYTLRQAESYFTTEAETSLTPSVSGTYYIDLDGWGGDLGTYTVYVTQDQLGGNDDETLTGGDGNDWILGGCGDDIIDGGAAADFLDGEWGDDRLTGGAGGDTFTFYSDNWDDIRDNDADLWGNDTITDFDPSEDLIHFAGRIVRNLDDLTVTESGGNTILTASWGDSVTLIGVTPDQLSDDNFKFRVGVRIEGGNIEGGEAADSLVGSDDANDTIYGHGGDDVLSGGGGNDYLRGFEGDDTIFGGDGIDIIGGEEGNDVIDGGDGDDFILSNEGDDSVIGGAGNDLIESSLGDDTLRGGSGDDTLRPGRGDDQMSGGTGSDIFVIGRVWGDDTISDFNIEEDTLDFQGSGLNLEDLTITANGNNTVVSDGTNSLTLVGVDADSLTAVAADVILEAGSVTSHYSEYARSDAFGDPTEDILVQTSVVVEDGGRWTPDEDGITRVSYSFLTYDSLVVTDDNSTWWFDAIEPVTPLTQFAVEQEIRRIEGFTNLDLVWVEDYGESGANIRLGYHQFVIGGASSAPYEGPYSGEVFVGIHVGEEFLEGFFIHELGHSLGFDDLDVWNEWTGQDYTIMSYIRSARYEAAEYSSVSTDQFMYADIAGLQYLYGVDTETTAGNETYSYDLSKPLLATIFDAGGDDTISVYGSGDAVHINLTPGTWSNIGPDIQYDGGGQLIALEPGTLFIMPNTVIENAIGSTGDDTITGNDANNLIRGMDGDDTVRAGLGDDTIWAGGGDQGADFMHGGAGKDLIGAGAGNDLVVGGDGSDTIFGGSGDDVVVLGDWDDSDSDGAFRADEVVTVATTTDVTYVGTGDDTVHGSDGSNTIGGGEGDDLVVAYAGDDIVYGGRGTGADTINGGAGADTLYASGGDDLLRGESGNDILWSGGGMDTVFGGDGDDTMWGGGGDDIFTGGDGSDQFAFGVAHGSDTVTDFNPDEDILNIQAAGFATFQEFQNEAVESADGVTISFGQTVVLLEGVSLADLTEDSVWI